MSLMEMKLFQFAWTPIQLARIKLKYSTSQLTPLASACSLPLPHPRLSFLFFAHLISAALVKKTLWAHTIAVSSQSTTLLQALWINTLSNGV
jgi:hypothetical protein